jgi:cell division protein FtsW (lipid II flippase)
MKKIKILRNTKDKVIFGLFILGIIGLILCLGKTLAVALVIAGSPNYGAINAVPWWVCGLVFFLVFGKSPRLQRILDKITEII